MDQEHIGETRPAKTTAPDEAANSLEACSAQAAPQQLITTQFSESRDALLEYARRIARRAHGGLDPADLLSDLFLTLMVRSADDTLAISNFFAYSRTCLQRAATRRLRQRAREEDALRDYSRGAVSPHSGLALSDTALHEQSTLWYRLTSLVALQLEALALKEQQALRLFHYEGCSYAEIATTLNIPLLQTGVFLSRTHAKIRRGVIDAMSLHERTTRLARTLASVTTAQMELAAPTRVRPESGHAPVRELNAQLRQSLRALKRSQTSFLASPEGPGEGAKSLAVARASMKLLDELEPGSESSVLLSAVDKVVFVGDAATALRDLTTLTKTRAALTHPHLVVFNIGACLYALGRYKEAQTLFSLLAQQRHSAAFHSSALINLSLSSVRTGDFGCFASSLSALQDLYAITRDAHVRTLFASRLPAVAMQRHLPQRWSDVITRFTPRLSA